MKALRMFTQGLLVWGSDLLLILLLSCFDVLLCAWEILRMTCVVLVPMRGAFSYASG